METEPKPADATVETAAEITSATTADHPAPTPASASPDGDPNLGFLELMRTSRPDRPDTDPTDMVLTRCKRSAWDY